MVDLRRRIARPALSAAVWVAFSLLVGLARAQSVPDARVALVIGNGAYDGVPLANPANDAREMARTLTDLGFQVVEVRDATKVQMAQALSRVHDALRGRHGVGMLYYAGHGLQLDWRNYMLPVDARPRNAADVQRQALDVQQVMDTFRSAGNRMNIVVLDACRDNPFGSETGARGLAQMDAPPGTLLAFATAPGNVAEDGDAATGNGLYTRFLVKELRSPGARIEEVFKRVRLQVRRASQGRQVPWESTSLESDFYFDPAAAHQREADTLGSVGSALLQQKADWDRIKASADADDFYAYLQKYPDGLISEQAQFRLHQLQRSRLVVPPLPGGVVMLPTGAMRYRLGDEWEVDVVDGFTGIARRSRHRVTRVDGQRVEIDDGALAVDQMGSVLKNTRGTKDPGLLMTPAELSVGKRWRSAFTNTVQGNASLNFYDFHVVALEDVTVPAGTFKAFKIERRGQARRTGAPLVYMEGTSWVDPATMRAVRTDSRFIVGGRVTDQDSVRLVSQKRGPL